MKRLFLDFDGVLFDTAREAYLLSRYAYYDVSPFDEIDENEYKNFYQNKYLVTNSWQYFYLIKSINSSNVEETFKNYILYRNDEDMLFDKKFQECRNDLMINHFDFWNNLDTPYPFFEQIKRLHNKPNITIISTKNKKAIKEKLDKYNLKIDESDIIGKEILKDYLTKGDFLSKYLIENNITDAIFVDDSIENIESCRDIKGLLPIQASWGYCNPKYTGKNCKEIISVIKEFV